MPHTHKHTYHHVYTSCTHTQSQTHTRRVATGATAPVAVHLGGGAASCRQRRLELAETGLGSRAGCENARDAATHIPCGIFIKYRLAQMPVTTPGSSKSRHSTAWQWAQPANREVGSSKPGRLHGNLAPSFLLVTSWRVPKWQICPLTAFLKLCSMFVLYVC